MMNILKVLLVKNRAREQAEITLAYRIPRLLTRAVLLAWLLHKYKKTQRIYSLR